VKAGRQRALARCKQIVINHDKTESRKLRAESRIQFARLATGQAVGSRQNITVKAGRCKQIVINHDKTESRKLRAESRIQFARLATGQAVGQKQ